MDDEEKGIDMALVGIILYGFASGVVTAVVLLDYLANISVYTTSYLMGAPPFIVINLVVTVWFVRAFFKGPLAWYTYLIPVVAYILISWLFHGISPMWRTVTMSALVLLGVALVLIGTRTGSR
ncbi:MAG: hypothetical protein JSW25_10275 [Thermoplasmata archaeon]|nr:MAG: hypothetical protein JSW25_10275 [Thermoplasmata archaeon]